MVELHGELDGDAFEICGHGDGGGGVWEGGTVLGRCAALVWQLVSAGEVVEVFVEAHLCCCEYFFGPDVWGQGRWERWSVKVSRVEEARRQRR